TWSATRAWVAESSSLSRKAESSSSVGSAGVRGSFGMGILPGGKKIRMPLQMLLDRGAGAGDPRRDGAERHATHAGDLVICHAIHVPQDDGHAHVVVERRDADPHQPRALVRFGALLWIRRRDPEADDVRCFLVGHDPISPSPPKMVVTKVRGDLEQPG